MLEVKENKAVSTEGLVKMSRLSYKTTISNLMMMLKNKFLEQQSLRQKFNTKFAPPYACIFMDDLQTNFLQSQSLQPLVCFRYIDDIFFIWTHGNDKLESS